MEKTRSAPQHARLRRLRGGATSAGPEYEFKLAGLVALRARRLGFQFELFSNVAAARPCDDLVLRVHYPYKATVFVQLKHGKGEQTLKQQAFLRDTGDFCLAKYFAFYKEFCNAWRLRETVADEDMRLLTDCAMENVHLVLYTTKRLSGGRGGRRLEDSEQSVEESEDSLETCEAYEALLGTRDGRVHRFGPKDEEVWRLFDGKEGKEQYQKEFLPRLALFHSQAPADALDAFILREINLLFGAPLPAPRADHLLVQYLAALKGWAQDDARDFCLSHSSRELEETLGGVLEAAGRVAAGRGQLLFQDTHCIALRAALTRPGTLLVTVCGMPPGIRAAKLLQVLEADFGGRWTYVNEEAANDLPPAALAAACGARGGVVVVDGEKELREHVLRLLGIARSLRTVVVLCSPGEELGAEHQDWVEVHEDWRLAHLSPDTQEHLLDRKLLFQGQVLRLRDLQELWPRLCEDVDGAFINALLQGAAAIGSTPSMTSVQCSEDSDLHVPRTLQHAVVLKDDVIELRQDSEHLALSGFSVDQTKWMERVLWEDWNLVNTSKRFSTQTCNNTKWWTVLSVEGEWSSACDEAAFKRLCEERPRGNIHWVQRASGGVLVWRATRGSARALQPFVLAPSHACQLPPAATCVHATHAERDAAEWGARTGLLVGEAGIGKSRFLANAAAEARRLAPARWAVHVALLAHRDLLRAMPRNPYEIGPNHAAELVAAAAGVAAPEEAAGRRYLEVALQQSGAVDLFVDGVDELCPSDKKQILRVLKLLLETRARLVWVASRPEVEESLRRILKCVPSSLRPLTATEQKRFLCAHWATSLGADPSAFAEVATEMMLALASAPYGTGEDQRCLLDVPLHLDMAAVAFAADAADAIRSGCQMFQARGLTIYDLYRRFIQLKRKRIMEYHGLTRGNVTNFYVEDLENKTFNKIHMAYAIHLLVSTDVLPDVDPRPFEEALTEYQPFLTKEKAGIIWLAEDGCLQFSHYTMVEYFAALWLFENFENAGEIVSAVFRHQKASVVRIFFDSMLVEGLPLHRAAMAGDCEALEVALAEGASVHSIDKGGRSALHMAASYNRRRAVQFLLEAGSDPTKKENIFGWAPVMFAIDAGDLEMAEMQLVSGIGRGVINRDMIPSIEKEFLNSAIRFGFEKVARWFIESGHPFSQNDLNTMLHTAASEGHSSIVDLLMENGVSPYRIHNKTTALHIAAINGHVSAAGSLLRAKGNLNIRDELGDTALHCAAKGDHREIAELLVSRGADTNATNTLGRTPLHAAVYEGSLDVVDFLVTDGGVDVEQPQKQPCAPLTPLSMAVIDHSVAMVQLLLNRGAKLQGPTLKGKWSPLHVASANGFTQMMEFLLDAGADPNAFHGGNLAPLHRAVIGGHMEAVRHLVAAGADVDERCSKERTPLHYASEKNAPLMVKFLLDNGCSPHGTDKNWQTPYDIAATSEYSFVATIIAENSNSNVKSVIRRWFQTLRRFVGPVRWVLLLLVLIFAQLLQLEQVFVAEFWPIVHVSGLSIETVILGKWFGWKRRKEKDWAYRVIQYVMYYADFALLLLQNFDLRVIVTVFYCIAVEISSGLCAFKERQGNIRAARKIFLIHYHITSISLVYEAIVWYPAALNSSIVFCFLVPLLPYVPIACRRLPWRCWVQTSTASGSPFCTTTYYLVLFVGFIRWLMILVYYQSVRLPSFHNEMGDLNLPLAFMILSVIIFPILQCECRPFCRGRPPYNAV